MGDEIEAKFRVSSFAAARQALAAAGWRWAPPSEAIFAATAWWPASLVSYGGFG